MPLYDYRCGGCRRMFTKLVPLRQADVPATCPQCGVPATKAVTGCAFHRSEASRLADYDPASARRPDFYRDPRNVGLGAKRRLRDQGLDLGPAVDEIVEKGRTGRILDDVP